MGIAGQHHAPAALPLAKRSGSHCAGGWMGSGTGLDRCEKISPLPGLNPRAVEPVASCYTD